MSKIVQAINAMIVNHELIDNVSRNKTDELFFLYDQKYLWSLRKNEDSEYILFYYPKANDAAHFAALEGWEFEHIDYVRYSSKDINTREAIASFTELYTIVQEKIYGMDNVLDDIISGHIPF